jgi:hypothetical protein
MEEIWKDIGIKKYAVSNMGNVRGADGIRLLKSGCNEKGYKHVVICKDGIQKNKKIHHLVMEAFVGERPIGYDTDHINRIRGDNRLENLRYCSKRDNMLNTCRTRTDIQETDQSLRVKIYKKEYVENNKEKILETQKKYRQKKKEAKL